MSTRAKIFFASSVVGAIVVLPGVHWMQADQRDTIRQGPIKDAERRQRSLTSAQTERVSEYEEQKMLREKYSAEQEVMGLGEVKAQGKE